MKVVVDRARCEGHNRCYAAFPEIFDVDDEAKAFVHINELPPEWEQNARRAIANCPEHAISIQ